MRIEALAHRLGLQQTRQGWEGPCPSCGYRSGFSLVEKAGKFLVACHAGGCHWEEIRPFLVIGDRSDPVVDNSKVELARTLFGKGLSAKGTVVETYLKSRGLSGKVPASIRFLPAHRHGPSGQIFPVMIAAVTKPDGKLMGIHRTFLMADGSGKAGIQPNKMSLGPIRGGAVCLGDEEENLLVAEGLENALTVQEAMGLPCWAGLSAAGLAAMELPSLPMAREITICTDPDTVGLDAAEKAAIRWAQEGRVVKIAKPPSGFGDFNEVYLEGNSYGKHCSTIDC